MIIAFFLSPFFFCFYFVFFFFFFFFFISVICKLFILLRVSVPCPLYLVSYRTALYTVHSSFSLELPKRNIQCTVQFKYICIYIYKIFKNIKICRADRQIHNTESKGLTVVSSVDPHGKISKFGIKGPRPSAHYVKRCRVS